MTGVEITPIYVLFCSPVQLCKLLTTDWGNEKELCMTTFLLSHKNIQRGNQNHVRLKIKKKNFFLFVTRLFIKKCLIVIMTKPELKVEVLDFVWKIAFSYTKNKTHALADATIHKELKSLKNIPIST